MTGEPPEPMSDVERLFDLVLARERDERAAILDRACSDPAVRREVEALLEADEQASGFLELPPAPSSDRVCDARIGPYRLLRTLGEGETSTVYLAARDDDQYRQEVAIKLIRPGMDSRQILSRFHQERQILASLSHPHIARLLDGGSTPAGQPYFVMEYVDGEPLDVHCRERNLSLARRLALFGLVCQAVHVAHRNLVVHRDLKPGNILVDRDGTPKLVDFGIAKLLGPELAGVERAGVELAGVERAGVEPTETVARLMTPHYASPEQVQGKPVSTASDVYSLGVVLYKLLTGQRPYELGALSLQEIERVVCEATPPPPSHVLRSRAGERLPRDLDNIVLMAMRKQPERRYASAQELADDVRRCLERRPVLARRDTLGYRVSSFVHRNAGAVAAAAVIFLSIIGGAVATTWQWRQAVAERRRAETQQKTAEQTRNFVVELFKVANSPAEPHEVTVRELLEHGAAELRAGSEQPPEVRAALTHTLGVVYRNLGDYGRAASLLDEAVTARSNLPGSELPLAESLYQLGSIDSDNGNYLLADRFLHRALAIRAERLGPDDLSLAEVLERLADNVGYNVPLHDAIDHSRRALQIRRAHLAPADPQVVSSIAGLGAMYSLAGYYENADALFAEGLAIRRGALLDEQCQSGYSTLLYQLGLLRYREGYFAEAEAYTNTALTCLGRTLGGDHVVVVDDTAMLILIWGEQGRYEAAAELAQRSLTRRSQLHGHRGPAIDNALHQLAHALCDRGDLIDAEHREIEALSLRRNAYGRVHASVAESLKGLGDIRLARGDAPSSEAAYREAIDIWRLTLGQDHPSVAEAMRGLSEALWAQHRLADAAPIADNALALQRRRLRPGHPAIARTLVALGIIERAGSPAAAESRFREALAIQRAALPPGHAQIARTERLLAECLALPHRAAAATPPGTRRGVEALRAPPGDVRPAAEIAWRRRRGADPPPPP